MGSSAVAQAQTPIQATPQELDRVQVEARGARTGATASKDGAPLRETPQAMNTIDAQTLALRRPLTLNEALRDVPGVVAGTAGRRGFDDFTIRGFSQSAFAFRDGLRFDPGFLLEQELFGLQRIDVLKGPASVLYGTAGPGGVVNAISKTPDIEDFGMLEASAGSDALARLAFDTAGGIDAEGRWRYRLTALDSDRNDSVDGVGTRRDFLAPSLRWAPSDRTALTVFAVYQHDSFDRVLALPAAGTVLPNRNGDIDRDTYLGEPGRSGLASTQRQLGYRFEHRFDERFAIQQQARHTDYDLGGLNIIAGTLAANGRTLSRRGVTLDVQNRVTTLDTRLLANFGAGALRHEAVFGVDVLHFRNDQVQRNATLRAIDVFAPNYGGAIALTSLASDRLQKLTQTGAYAQWRTHVGERWVLLGGGRYDWVRDDIRNDLTARRSVQRDEAFTGRAGVVYLGEHGLAPYLSYATSFVPVSGNPTRGGEALRPEEGAQWEIGLRWDAPDGRFAASLAAFDLTRRNILSADPADTRFSVQVGEQVHRGLEAEATLRPHPAFDVNLNYAYLDAEITRSTTGNQGLRPANAPEHSGGVWTTLRMRGLGGFDPGFDLDVSLGARYLGERQGNTATVLLPDVTLIDAAVMARVGAWQFALNGRNLSDRTWYAGASGTAFVSIGESRSLQLTAGYRW
jgi:iron complex outermembrane recepter protein